MENEKRNVSESRSEDPEKKGHLISELTYKIKEELDSIGFRRGKLMHSHKAANQSFRKELHDLCCEEGKIRDKLNQILNITDPIVVDPDNDLLKTVDVARMLHFSEATVHKMRRSNQIPEYAMPKVCIVLDEYYWSKEAIQRWITETMSSDEEEDLDEIV